MAVNRHVELRTYRNRLYGCLRSDGTGVVLTANDPGFTAFGRYAIRGPMAAVEILQTGKEDATRWVLVIDVVEQRLCQRLPAGTGGSGSRPVEGEPPGGRIRGEVLTDLAVSRTGAVAFIAGPGFGPWDPSEANIAPWDGYELVVSDRAGTRQLDAGIELDPASLRLRGDRMVWRSAGQPHTTKLDSRAMRCRGRFWG